MKHTELARRSGCKQATISKIERGSIKASAAIPALAHELGCDALWLERGEVEPNWATSEKRTVMMPPGESASNQIGRAHV